jgi:Tfp pilus assembly protein PilF
VAGVLTQIYAGANRASEAQRVLDELAKAVADDADQLYFVAHMYEIIDQSTSTETVLGEVLKLDPRHAPAANDLGYMWADRGHNLDQSEQLIRQALEVEPENSAYLDSLGWVLYKRGKFDDARTWLAKAVDVADFPDPIVLDHLADTLYRLNQHTDARATWERAAKRLTELDSTRAELTQLRGELRRKLAQIEADRPVDVAPLVSQGP